MNIEDNELKIEIDMKHLKRGLTIDELIEVLTFLRSLGEGYIICYPDELDIHIYLNKR